MIQRALVVFSLGLGCCVSAHAQIAANAIAPSARITARIDETQRVRLPGNVRPEATRANDRGIVADSLPLQHMQLLLQRSSAQEQSLERAIDALHDPKSPYYHHWLNAENFGNLYGVAPADVQKITDWLGAHGFTVNQVYPSAMLIDFSGSAGSVREAFHTEIHHLAASGGRHIANMSDPEIPAALAPAIKGVVSLNDFRPHSLVRPRPKFSTSNGAYNVVPADLATIYNFNPVFAQGNTGQGQTIALIEDTDIFSAQDWTTFRNTFGLSGYTSASLLQLHPAPVSGANNCADPGISSDDIEAMVDAEWASAAAPGAKIVLAACANTSTTFGGLIALQNLLNASTPPPIVSISYGECEAALGTAGNAAFASTYQQAVAEGVSVFVSAGDEGAAGCDAGHPGAFNGISVNGFASTPYNVAVGGTDFSDTYADTNSTYWKSNNDSNYASARSYVPEIPWNNSCASALIGDAFGLTPAYGSGGLCNNSGAQAYALNSTAAGSGGPSNCASGAPSIDSNNLVAGVGSCVGTAKPSWQSGVLGLPSDGVRDLPDVSLFASDGAAWGILLWGHAYIECYSDVANGGSPCTGTPENWTPIGGTSISAPILAGIQALINQKTGAAQGNPNYVYYKLAASQYGSSGSASCNSSNGNAVGSGCIFYDVTQGDNVVPCFGYDCYGATGSLTSGFYYGVLSTSAATNSPAFAAQTGWDFATGIGTVNVANLVNNWSQ